MKEGWGIPTSGIFSSLTTTELVRWYGMDGHSLKGILHQKIFYRLNLIFWIVMGCGIARFGRKGLKTTET